MREQTRTLRKKPYGEAEAESWDWVIWGLSGDDRSDWTPAAKTRVSTLLLDMKTLETIREELQIRFSGQKRHRDLSGSIEWPGWAFVRPEVEELNRKGRKLISKVNAQLGFYKWSPGILTVSFENFHQHPQSNTHSESDYQEQVAVESLLSELSEGRINRFRVCRQCQCWFYAVAAHQVSCSESCRKKFASKDESFKSKRRRYMSEYRKRERARSVAALTKARKS